MRPNEMSPESEKEAILHKYETVNNALSQKEAVIYKKERELSGARSDLVLANLNLEIEKGKNAKNLKTWKTQIENAEMRVLIIKFLFLLFKFFLHKCLLIFLFLKQSRSCEEQTRIYIQD